MRLLRRVGKITGRGGCSGTETGYRIGEGVVNVGSEVLADSDSVLVRDSNQCRGVLCRARSQVSELVESDLSCAYSVESWGSLIEIPKKSENDGSGREQVLYNSPGLSLSSGRRILHIGGDTSEESVQISGLSCDGLRHLPIVSSSINSGSMLDSQGLAGENRSWAKSLALHLVSSVC